MPKSKFVELILEDSPALPRHSLAGYLSCSDYKSDGKRHLFLRLPDADVGVPQKPKRKRRKKAVGIGQPSGEGVQS